MQRYKRNLDIVVFTNEICQAELLYDLTPLKSLEDH